MKIENNIPLKVSHSYGEKKFLKHRHSLASSTSTLISNLSNHSIQSDPLSRRKSVNNKNDPLINPRDFCYECNEKFSLLRPRHHCRNCGRLYCSNCSSFRIYLNNNNNNKQRSKSRVCTKCYNKLTNGISSPPNSFIHSKVWVPRGIFPHMLTYLDHKTIFVVSLTCRWWYKRSSLDIIWRPLYIRYFDNLKMLSEITETSENFNLQNKIKLEEEKMINFYRQVMGIPINASIPWKKKFEIRWIVEKIVEKNKKFKAIALLLNSLDLSKYISVFEEEEIDIESLRLMNAKNLSDLGIPTGPRVKLLNAAACLAEFDDEVTRNESEKNNADDTVDTSRKNVVTGPNEDFAKETSNDMIQKWTKDRNNKSSLVRRIQQSIVRLAVLTIDGALRNVGSGIIVHEKGLIVTARHCLVGQTFDAITNDKSFMILVAPTESTSSPPIWKFRASVIPHLCDEELDYALLWLECEIISDPPSGLYIGDVTSDRKIATNWDVSQIEGSNFNILPNLPAIKIGNSDDVEPGDELWMFGYPSSGHNTITIHHSICSGTDSQIYKGKEIDKAMLRTAAQLDNGFSGGAAVSQDGKLVGFISFSVLRQDRLRSINMFKEVIEFAKMEKNIF